MAVESLLQDVPGRRSNCQSYELVVADVAAADSPACCSVDASSGRTSPGSPAYQCLYLVGICPARRRVLSLPMLIAQYEDAGSSQ